MNKENIKAFIGKSKKGIVLIVAAALLSQLLNIAQYVYTRHTVREQTEKKAVNNFREVQRVVNLKTTVETAVQNAMGDVLANINEPDNFYSIVTRLVSRNRYIVGSTVAMTPGFYAEKDSLFAPFAYPEAGGSQPVTKLFLYNDGLYETMNNKKEAYGQKRMLTRLESLIRTGCGTEKLLAKMAETIESYRGSEPQTDDVTMMVIKMTRME